MEKLLILWWNTKNQGRMKKETIISLSQRTGFSVSTVSRVLSGQAADYRISAKTIALIESEAKRCGYTPSLLAKGLRTNRTHTIGLVVPCIGNPYFAMIASVVTAEAKRLGYTIIIVDSVESEADEQAGIRSLLSHKVDGIIVVPCGNDPSLLESVNAATPVVLIDRHYDNSELSYVCTDNYQGSVEAVRYLVACGHRDILCIRGNLQSSPVKARVKGYLDVLQDAGLADRAMVRGASFSVDNGYLETKLALGRAPDGDFRHEQHDSARNHQGGARIGAARARRHFAGVVRQFVVLRPARPGDYPCQPAHQQHGHAGHQDSDGENQRPVRCQCVHRAAGAVRHQRFRQAAVTVSAHTL